MSTRVRMGKIKPTGGEHSNYPNTKKPGHAPVGFQAPTGKKRYPNPPSPTKGNAPTVGYLFGKHE